MNLKPYRLLVALWAALLLSPLATAQPGVATRPVAAAAEGTEFVMLDARGSRIVGRGSVEDSVLRLTVGESVGDFVLLVVLSDGEVKRYVGRAWFGDSFRISLADGGQVELAELVAGFGLTLRLERLEPETAQPPVKTPPTEEPDDDDDQGEAPGDDDDADDGDDDGDDDSENDDDPDDVAPDADDDPDDDGPDDDD